MDPEYERRLRDEVIYLHSLWHKGPPKPPHHPTPSRLLHHPSSPTQFKRKESNKPRNKKGAKPIKNHSDSGKEWPCKPTSDSSPATTSEWKTSWPQPNSQTLLPSVEEKAKLAANQAQLKALKRVREFFESRDDDDDEEEDDSEDDDDDLMEKKEYSFFVGVFMEDGKLREYYEKNYYNGEFSCLVCGGLGKKLASKKYKDCVALVQHSISIAKTKKRRAHRAYGQAICKVLGWDIARLPTIVSELSEKRELSSTNSGQCEVEDSGQAEAEANVGEATKDGLSAIENKEDSANGSNSGQCEDGGKGECQAQGRVGEVTCDDSNSLDIKEGSMRVDDPEFGEVEGDGKGKANVGEGNKDDLSALENNEDSANRSNSGQCEDRGKGECEAQENVGEGTKNKSTSLDSKEGSMDVDNSGQGEGEDKANIVEGTENNLTNIENKEALVNVSDCGEFPIKEFVSTENWPSNCESTFSEHNPLTGAEAPENLEDFIQAVPEIVENKEAGLLNDGEHPKEESIVGEKNTDAFPDDLIRSDAPSWQENSGDSGNNNQTC